MLQKICDACKSKMDINEYYEEGTFNLIINTEDGKELSFGGDLCEKCEKEIIEKIKAILYNYNIKEEITEEEKEETKLIEDKEETREEDESFTPEL